MDSLISTFHIDWHLIAAQAVNFIVVFFVLYYFALRPLKKLMDERTNTISGGLENAKKQEELFAVQKDEYEKTLAQARKEAQDLMKEVKKDAESKRAELLAKAQEESKTIVEAGKKQLLDEKARMLDDAKKEIVSVVMAATEKVLNGAVSGKIEEKLVEDSIKNI